MGSFNASLRTMGDRTGLPATLTLDDGHLSIDANDQTIGVWSLDEIRLEPTPTGYRLAAEGEQILIDMPDTDEFELALRGKKTRKRDSSAPKKQPKAAQGILPPAAVAEAAPNKAKTRPEKSPKAPKAPKTAEPADENAAPSGFMSRIDKVLDRASERWGSLLPPWVFTRGTVYALTALALLILILPNLGFYLLLFTGVLLVMLGAVVYTDTVTAAKWLPGRVTPMHVLIFGVGVLLLGVMVGVASDNRIYVFLLGLVVVAAGLVATYAGKRTS